MYIDWANITLAVIRLFSDNCQFSI